MSAQLCTSPRSQGARTQLGAQLLGCTGRASPAEMSPAVSAKEAGNSELPHNSSAFCLYGLSF